MALTTRITLAVATVVALLVIWILPPRSCLETNEGVTQYAMCGGAWYFGTRTQAEALRDASERLRAAARSLALADTLRHALSSGKVVRTADGSVAVIYEEPLRADSARVWLELARAERDRIPGAGTRARIVVAVRSAGWRQRQDSLLSRETRQSVQGAARFASATATDSSCFVVLRIDDPRRTGDLAVNYRGRQRGAFLGECGLMARFGIPGPSVGREMLSLYGEDRIYSYFREFVSSVVSDVQGTKRGSAERANPSDYRLAACVLGLTKSCATAMGFDPGQPGKPWSTPYYGRDFVAFLLAQDPQGFARFWRSRQPIQGALAEGFGHPAGELVQTWARHRYVVEPRGPATESKNLLAAIGWFGGAMIIAMAVGMRRRAGT